jgi:hypothetical protein
MTSRSAGSTAVDRRSTLPRVTGFVTHRRLERHLEAPCGHFERQLNMTLWHWMQGGGWGIWFVLAFGLLSLASGVGFAVRPDPRREGAVRSFSRATLFSIVSIVSLNLAAVGSKIPATPEWSHSPDLHLMVMEGIAESLVPSIVGCALLSLVWLCVAVGQRRLARELPS